MSLVDGKILEIASDQTLITKVILLTSKGSLRNVVASFYLFAFLFLTYTGIESKLTVSLQLSSFI